MHFGGRVIFKSVADTPGYVLLSDSERERYSLMFKLVAKYLADDSTANARRLVNYLNKHPMAVVRAGRLELGLIAEARLRVAEGR